MDLVKSFGSAWGVLRRDTTAITALSQDQTALVPGLLFASLAGFLGSLPGGIPVALGAIVISPIAVFFAVLVLFLIAKLFGGAGDYMTLWRPYSHAYLLSIVGITVFVPILGFIVVGIATIYFLIVLVSIVRATQHISRGRAIAVSVIALGLPIFLLTVIIVLAASASVAPFIYPLF